MTLGSCDSPRIARPGRSTAPRFGLLLGLLVAGVGLVVGCVDQPLIPVNEPAATGGSSSTTGSGHGGSGHGDSGNGGAATGGSSSGGSGFGGWFGAGGSSQSGGNVGYGGQTVPCILKAGYSCAEAPCCDNRGLVCEAEACCKVLGQPCSNSYECCSNDTCSNGICSSSATSTCVPADYQCNRADQCCSHSWDATAKVCREIEGCKPVGELCQWSWDCCSGDCTGQNGAWGHCHYENNSVCRNPGEVCNTENALDTCCTGLICRTGIEGIKRCERRSNACGSPPDTCSVASDCCGINPDTSGHCILRIDAPIVLDPNGKNYGTCQVCGQDGRKCKVDVDCCDGYLCLASSSSSSSSKTCVLKIATNSCGSLSATCASSSIGTGGNGGVAGSNSTSATTCCSGYVCDSQTSKCVKQ